MAAGQCAVWARRQEASSASCVYSWEGRHLARQRSIIMLLCFSLACQAGGTPFQGCVLVNGRSFAGTQVNNVPGARLSSSAFTKFWVNYDNGSITVGSGDPGSHAFYRWTDSNAIPHIRHAGVGPAWAVFVCLCYRPPFLAA